MEVKYYRLKDDSNGVKIHSIGCETRTSEEIKEFDRRAQGIIKWLDKEY